MWVSPATLVSIHIIEGTCHGLLALLQTQDQSCSRCLLPSAILLPGWAMGQLLHLFAALTPRCARQDRSEPAQPWKKSNPCKASSLHPQRPQTRASCLTADSRERCSSAAFPAGDPLGCRAVTGRSCQRRIDEVGSPYLSLNRRQRHRRVVEISRAGGTAHTAAASHRRPSLPPSPTRSGELRASVLLQSLVA